jgi:hypothetical protein
MKKLTWRGVIEKTGGKVIDYIYGLSPWKNFNLAISNGNERPIIEKYYY